MLVTHHLEFVWVLLLLFLSDKLLGLLDVRGYVRWGHVGVVVQCRQSLVPEPFFRIQLCLFIILEKQTVLKCGLVLFQSLQFTAEPLQTQTESKNNQCNAYSIIKSQQVAY